MNKQDFFRCKDVVVYTTEALTTLITSILPDLQDDYILGDTVIGHCTECYQRNHFPMVFIPLTDKEHPEFKDTAVYLPEVDEIFVWVGELNFRALSKSDIGRRFKVTFEDGEAVGEVDLYDNKEFCLKYYR